MTSFILLQESVFLPILLIFSFCALSVVSALRKQNCRVTIKEKHASEVQQRLQIPNSAPNNKGPPSNEAFFSPLVSTPKCLGVVGSSLFSRYRVSAHLKFTVGCEYRNWGRYISSLIISRWIPQEIVAEQQALLLPMQPLWEWPQVVHLSTCQSCGNTAFPSPNSTHRVSLPGGHSAHFFDARNRLHAFHWCPPPIY